MFRVFYNIQQLEDDVTVDIFETFCKNKPLLLYPVFEAQVREIALPLALYVLFYDILCVCGQERLCSRILGHKFWNKNSEKRFTLSNGKVIPLRKYMEQVCI